MIEFVPDPEQRIFASPEQERISSYVEVATDGVMRDLSEGIVKAIKERAAIVRTEQEAVIQDYVDAGFDRVCDYLRKCDFEVVTTEFADEVEEELRQVTPYALQGDNSHWAVQEFYESSLKEDAFRQREDEWPETRFPLEETLEYIEKYEVGPQLESPLHPSQYRKRKHRWDNWYVDGIDYAYDGPEEEE